MNERDGAELKSREVEKKPIVISHEWSCLMWLEGFFPLYPSWDPTIPSWDDRRGPFVMQLKEGKINMRFF